MRKMSGKRLIFIVPIALAVLFGGCAGPGSARKANAVRDLTADDLAGCTPAGSVHVSVADRLAQLQEVDGAVQEELRTLAAQSAVQLGGNAIVAVTGIDNGSQSFDVYRCP